MHISVDLSPDYCGVAKAAAGRSSGGLNKTCLPGGQETHKD